MKISVPPDIDEIGLFSDVHGEYMRILEMQQLREDLHHWFCLGDLVDKDVPTHNNQPSIRLVQKLNALAIRGNHEQKTISRKISEYDDNSREFFDSLPDSLEITFGNMTMTAIHYIPSDPIGMKPRDKLIPFQDMHEQYCSCFTVAPERIFLVGHAHVGHDITIGSTRIINPGSLAGKGEGASSFAVLSHTGECNFVSLE